MTSSSCSLVGVNGIGPEYRRISEEYSLEKWKRLEKHWEYLKTGNPMSIFTLSFLVAAGVFSGATVGSAVGGIIPWAISAISPGYKETDCVARIRNLISANFGGVGGGLIGVHLHMYLDEHYGSFGEWYLQGLTKDMVGIIRDKYMNDPILCLFECAISKDFMLFPVFSPTGMLYDLPQLRALPRDILGRVADPLRNPAFNPDHTKPWHELAYLNNKRIIFLIQQDQYIFVGENDRGVRERLAKVLEVLSKEAEHCYEKSKTVIENKRKMGSVDRDEYIADLNRFFDSFGDNPRSQLNWDLRWKEILEDRLLGVRGKEETKERPSRRDSLQIDRGMIKQT